MEFRDVRQVAFAQDHAVAAPKRLVYDAFDLRVVYDKVEGRGQITATLAERMADLLEGAVAPEVIAGAGLIHKPATVDPPKRQAVAHRVEESCELREPLAR